MLTMLIGGSVMLGKLKDVISSNIFGKLATLVMSLSIFSLIVFDVPSDIAGYIMIGAFLLLMLSLGSYVAPFYRAMSKKDRLQSQDGDEAGKNKEL